MDQTTVCFVIGLVCFICGCMCGAAIMLPAADSENLPKSTESGVSEPKIDVEG